MQPEHPGPSDPVSLTVRQWIDAVCTRFEIAWRQEPPPRIEDFLEDAAGPRREALLRELLRVEIDCRRQRGSVPSVEDYLDRFPDQEQLIRAEVAAEADTVTEPAPATPPAAGGERDSWPLVPGYEVRGFVAEGGMGEVWRVYDPDFGRPLAVKVTKANHAHHPEVEQRFLAEARITGRLQHPGIPPVHEIGRLADGRPFLAMKLIEGETLHDLLKRRATPASELPRFVAVFGQVCQAVGYAHSQGVIHRDLKPRNLMVGAFGEVQVMDWGLAKVLGGRAGECSAGGAPAVAAGATGAGLGTPGYLSPEAARGEIGRVDERADVFGLGSILCVILTGQPAFRSPNRADALREAEAGNLVDAFARLDACGADAELVVLAQRCLAPDRERRPRDAATVGREVEAYRAGVEERARKAELERAAALARAEEAQLTAREAEAREAAEKRQAEEARARAEAERCRADESERRMIAERRGRRLTVALAAAALLLVVGGGAWAWLAQQERERKRGVTRETDTRTRLTMEQAREKSQDGWKRHDLARIREAQADIDKAVKYVFVRGNASPELRQEVEALQEEIGTTIRAAERNAAFLAALADVYQPRETNTYETDKKGRMVALALPSVEEQSTAAFGRWGIKIDSDPLEQTVTRLARQPEPVVQEVVAGLDAWALERRRSKPSRPEVEWRRLLDVAERLDRDPLRKRLRRLLADSPLEWTWGNTAAWLCTREELRQLAAKVRAADEPVLGLLALAHVLRVFGETATAEGKLRAALARRPREVVLLTALGQLLEQQKPARLAEAVGCYRAARAARPELGIALSRVLMSVKQAPEAEAVILALIGPGPATPDLRFYLGNALRAQKKLEEAVDAYRKSIKLKPDHAGTYLNLGVALDDQKKLDEAVVAYRQAIKFKPDYADAHNDLGNALAEQKKLEEAVAAFRKAIHFKPDYAVGYYNLGTALFEQKKLEEAVVAFRQAIKFKPDFAEAHNNLGNALLDQKRLDEAVAAYRHAIELRPDLAEAYNNLGNALRSQKKLDEAVVAYRKSIKFRPDHAGAYLNLGVALAEQKKLEEAVAAFTKAIKLKPDLAGASYSLGNALLDQKKLKEAEAAFRQAIKLKPEDAAAHTNLGVALADQKKLDEAVAAFRQAIKFKPDLAEALYNLGRALADQQELEEAVAAYRQAIKLKPDYAEGHYNLGIALRKQKKLDEAVAAFRQTIKFRPDDAEAHYNLGNALADQKKLDEAVAAFKKAIELKPDYAEAYGDLGVALDDQEKLEEAVTAYRQAIKLKPDFAVAYNNLSNALRDQQKPVEAEAACRQAIKLKPDFAEAYNNLGNALTEQEKLDQAVAAYRQAIKLKPDYANAYNNLGNALRSQKKLDEAVAALRQAIKLKPDSALAYYNFGVALLDQQKPAKAEAVYRKAIELKPDFAEAYYNLGNALAQQKKLEEAVAVYRQAIKLKPDFAVAYGNLGAALLDQKKLEKAVAAFRQAVKLLPNHPVILGNLRRTERLLELDKRLLALLTKKDKPRSPQERIELAEFCIDYKRYYAAAVGFLSEAFLAEPKLAGALRAQYRYHAARGATLAAAGKGEDARDLNAEQRSKLRQQALDWLRADLDVYAKLAEKESKDTRQAVKQRLSYWLQDADLATVRDARELATLPDEQRKAWQQLWANVASLLKKCQ